jgi:tetratricopeptide (TPR) repeat protein
LGLATYRLGERGDDVALETEAIEASILQGDRRMEGSSRSYLAQILLDQGEVERAEREARAAVALLAVAPPIRIEAYGILATALLRQGRAKEALAAAELAVSTIAAIGGVERGESLARLIYAEALHAVDDPARARTAIALARDRVMARAETLRDPQVREAFVQNVPENARTLSLAREWLEAYPSPRRTG